MRGVIGKRPRFSHGIGYSLRAQGIQIALVVAQQLQVVKARATRQRIVDHVQHVVRLVIWQVPFEQLHGGVDLLGQPRVDRQHMEGTDAAARDRVGAVGHLAGDGPSGDHRPALVGPLLAHKVAGRFLLAFGENSDILVFDSKSLFAAISCFLANAL